MPRLPLIACFVVALCAALHSSPASGAIKPRDDSSFAARGASSPLAFRQGTFADEAVGWSGNLVKGKQWADGNQLYDAAGNRRQSGGKLGGGFVPPYETYEYEDLPNPTHKLLAVRDHTPALVHQFGDYDPNGNPGTWVRPGEGTRTFTWDALDRLVAISGSYAASYVYDPLGRRIEKTEAGSTTLYQYDGLDVVAEYSASHTLQATYVFGPGIDEPIKVRRDTTVSSYHADGLGSILAVARTTASGTDFATYTYGPFGEDEATTLEPGFANAYTYTGRERDGSGLYYYRARYYLAEVGRFLTPDPIGLRGGINPYAHVGSNPINFTDPFGLLPKNSYSNLASPLAGTVSQGGGGALSSLAGAGAGVFVGVNAAPYVSAAAAACPLCAVGAGVVGVGAVAYDLYQGFPATRSFFNSVGDTFKGQATFTKAFDTGIVFGGLGGAGLAARGASSPLVFRQGTFADEAVGWSGNLVKGKQWAAENPLTTANYAKRYGLPAENATPDWVVGGRIRGDYRVQPAPASRNNPLNTGGAPEYVPRNPEDVILEFFHMPD